MRVIRQHVLQVQAAATLSDAAGAEPRAGAVGCPGVEGGAQEGDVVFDVGFVEARGVGQAGEGADAGEDGVGLQVERNELKLLEYGKGW